MHPLMFNVRLIRFLALLPEGNFNKITRKFVIKHALLISTLFPSASTLVIGAARQLNHLEDINILIDHIIGINALIACVYMCECFLKNAKKVLELIKEILQCGEEFSAQDVVQDTEHRVQTYTKGILLYGMIGNLCYALFPLVSASQCEQGRNSPKLTKKRDPCGLIVRVWYPFDISESPLFYIVYFLQFYTCIVISVLVLMVTMLLVGFLMYATAFLKDCGERMRVCCDSLSSSQRERNVRFCVRYHIAIITFSSNITEAFGSMMLLHITLTSFQVSALGFEIIMVGSSTDSIRFGMHLCGWLMLLFLICFYGQKLVDESVRIGTHAYAASWYNSSYLIQKDLQFVIMRSQKPLSLSAASLGVMSLETFLGIMSTAYSYFTLLLNIKKD